MKFDWRRPLAPAVLVLGLLLCFVSDPIVGLGIFLVSFALILGVIIGTYSSIYIASSYLIVSKISAKDMQIEKNDKDDNDGAVV